MIAVTDKHSLIRIDIRICIKDQHFFLNPHITVRLKLKNNNDLTSFLPCHDSTISMVTFLIKLIFILVCTEKEVRSIYLYKKTNFQCICLSQYVL